MFRHFQKPKVLQKECVFLGQSRFGPCLFKVRREREGSGVRRGPLSPVAPKPLREAPVWL